MSDFTISAEGRVREATVRDIVAKLKLRFPETDTLAVEANLLVARTYGALSSVVAGYWAEFGLTGHRYNVLRLLLLADEKRLPMKDIAAGLNVGTTNVTSLIDGLERDGLVRRVNAQDDKRITYAQLTDEGEARFMTVYPYSSGRLRKAWGALNDDEKEILVHLLSKLRMALQVGNLSSDALESAGSLVEGAGERPRKRRTPARRRTAGEEAATTAG